MNAMNTGDNEIKQINDVDDVDDLKQTNAWMDGRVMICLQYILFACVYMYVSMYIYTHRCFSACQRINISVDPDIRPGSGDRWISHPPGIGARTVPFFPPGIAARHQEQREAVGRQTCRLGDRRGEVGNGCGGGDWAAAVSAA